MERKKERLARELDKKKADVKKVETEMNALRHHIAVANSKLHEDREAQTQMTKDNVLLQNEFAHLLKDAEIRRSTLKTKSRRWRTKKSAYPAHSPPRMNSP